VFVVHGEAQRLDQMQMAARVGRKTNDIARVGRNFGLNQDDIKHALIV
jgi:hypothetical protein